ncbi:MAG: isoaspartyl peptidase/L-asparaginase, partial [Myxococcales bacterium]|nr:isoaspartyl peptidase/L-asparaginase [Myxococcales bacterium]
QRVARGETLARIARQAHACFPAEGARGVVLAAIRALEDDPGFNAGWGSRLQRDGEARLSASLMDGRALRLSAVYNTRGHRHPVDLADALQARADRNLDGDGARLLMAELGIAPEDVRCPESLERWQRLLELGDDVDREGAIGSAGAKAADRAREAGIAVPSDFRGEEVPEEGNRYGTVGAVACDAGGLWASTSTGGRGHEAVGRISDSPTPAGNYACAEIGLSATGFGEQILDLNLAGRIATRVIDGASLEEALHRTFAEVERHEGLLGVIAVTARGEVGYAHSTEACGVAWVDGAGAVHVDRHGRS